MQKIDYSQVIETEEADMAASRPLVVSGSVKRAAIAYAVAWIVCFASYWIQLLSGAGSWVFGYILCWNYVLLPLAAFVACAYVGWRQETSAFPWGFVLILTAAYMLAPIVTFELSTALGLANIASGNLWLLLMGFIPGALGLICGQIVRAIFKAKRRNG